jgi:hypothetical protein
MQVVVINGMPRAGKDQFVLFCQKHITWCKNISTVDFVKQVANFCGWDGTKTPENRAFLSDLKDLLTKWNDIPFKKVKHEAERYNSEAVAYDFDTDEVLVFVHCREPEEITKFVKEMNAVTLLIRCDAIENNEQSNHADAEVFNYDYDYIVENNGTLEDLEESAITFLHEIYREKDLKIH